MTCFDLLLIVAVPAGLWLGASTGYARFGTAGAVAGSLLGGVLGYLLGRLPFVLAARWLMTGLSRHSSHRLRERLATEYYVSHLILAELMRRGEDISVDLPAVLALLRSDSPDERRFGFGSLQLAFPELARQLSDFDPADPTEHCREKLARIDSAA